MNGIDEEINNYRESIDDVKKKVNYKGWSLLLGVLLIGLTIGFTVGNSLDGANFISDECSNSVSCVDDCVSFYANQPVSNIDNHELECRYKCLFYKNCAVN